MGKASDHRCLSRGVVRRAAPLSGQGGWFLVRMQVGVGCRGGGTAVGKPHSFGHRLVGGFLRQGMGSAARCPEMDEAGLKSRTSRCSLCQDGMKTGNVSGMPSRDEKTETENKYRQRTGTGDCRGDHKCPFSGGGAGKSGSSIRLSDRDDGVGTGRRQGLAMSRIEPLCTCMCRYTRRPGHSAIAAPVTSRFVVVWYSNLAQKEQQVARTGRARACLPHGTKPAP